MGKPRYLRPDFIVALLAVVIGLCTMFVYIYQARIMSKQMHSTTWPYLETIFSNSGRNFSINVHNKGVGPAIVKRAFIVLDNARIADTQRNLDSVAYALTGKRGLLNGYTNVNNRVMSPGETIHFIEVTDSVNIKLLLKSLPKHSVRVEICYCSVFDECWWTVGSKVEPCESCDD